MKDKALKHIDTLIEALYRLRETIVLAPQSEIGSFLTTFNFIRFPNDVEPETKKYSHGTEETVLQIISFAGVAVTKRYIIKRYQQKRKVTMGYVQVNKAINNLIMAGKISWFVEENSKIRLNGKFFGLTEWFSNNEGHAIKKDFIAGLQATILLEKEAGYNSLELKQES